MTGIGIIANPHSKLNKRNPGVIRQIESICKDQAKFVCTENLEQLKDTLIEFSRLRIHTIGICGGDGTISLTLNEIYRIFPKETLPRILLLRGGTMNLIANELKVKGNPTTILTRFFLGASKDELTTRKLSSLRVNERFGYIYADGSHLNILEQFYEKKSSSLGAFILGLRILISHLHNGKLFDKLISSETMHIRSQGNFKRESLGNIAGTISRLPVGVPLLPLVSKHSERFQFTIISCQKQKLLWYLPAIMLKHKEGSSLGKFTFCEKRLQIEFQKPMRFTLDGEIFSASTKTMNLELGPTFSFISHL